ncbi:hypothetical protein TWF106_003834 [Orbilia oligospora]|uniref:Uncharacterized protein n=1 Tax=Orbilia oligospora TaxID=2813651 RepID=A0A7C8Q6U0_ORBOL|nr:hypothetical protein TWF106_003834 [Orbilia oligospora]KAF3216508.1 hypothetical protein TWF191_008996 [Orbilia oligospora]
MSGNESSIRYIIASCGSSLSGSPPPTSIPSVFPSQPANATATASISDTNRKLRRPVMAVSGSPSTNTALNAALLTTNPAIFIKDAFTTLVETWSPYKRAWIIPEILQCPVLKFALREGKVVVFTSGRINKVIMADKGATSKVPSYALVWPARSVESWTCDTHRARPTGGYLDVSLAMKFLDAPQLIAFGGGNTLPVILQPQQLSARFDYLRRLVSHVQRELKGSSTACLRFVSTRSVHPASLTLAERDSIPRRLSLSTDIFATAGSPYPTSVTAPGITANAQKYSSKVREHVGGDGANDTPIGPGASVAQYQQDDAILIDLLEPISECASNPAPLSFATPLAPSTLADLFNVQLGPLSLPPLPPSPLLNSYAEGLTDEPTAIATLNEAVVNSVTIHAQAYREALEKKQGYLEKLWLKCTEEIDRVALP